MNGTRQTLKALRNAAVSAAFFFATPAIAQEVTITSQQGGLSLSGRVIGFDGSYLQIESEYGPLSLIYDRVSCEGDACPDPETYVPSIRISGAARMADVLMPALIDGFARSRGWQVELSDNGEGVSLISLQGDEIVAQFALRPATSDEGFADLLAYQTDMVMSLREVRPDELRRALDAGVGALDAAGQSRIVALDALVPIVSPVRGTVAVSLTDMAQALSGDVQDWSEIGGPELPLTLHLGPAEDGQVQYALDRLLGARRAPSAGITYHDDLVGLAAAVAADPGALGLTDLGKISVAQQATLRDACGFVAVPRTSALKAQDYPLTAPMFLYLPEWRLHPIARDYLEFLVTPEAQLIVRRAGFIDHGPVPVPLDTQGQRFASAIAAAGAEVTLADLKEMVARLTGLQRQSLSFRFEAGAARLDAQSRANLFALAGAVRAGKFDRRALWLIGFSDGDGPAAENRALSETRAEAVRGALAAALGDQADRVNLMTTGFGEALPMACDDTGWGREMNRRVELWVSE